MQQNRSYNVCVEAEKYLTEKVKEFEQLEEYIFQESGGEAVLIIESNGTLHDIDYKGEKDEYFMVYWRAI